MNKKGMYRYILLGVILSGLIFILGIDRRNLDNTPITVYQVYLGGKTIGIIEDEQELYDLIDKEQESLKKEYNVDKVYAPINLETTKLVTYIGEVDSVKDVYSKIKDVEPFTVKGYEVTIIHSEDKKETINVLNIDDFENAVENTIKAFVEEEDYENYLNNTQEKITTTGSTIENISIKEEITTKEKYLSTDEKIFTDVNELSRYLLFGTTESQGTHIVRAGQTVKDIANEYELNVKEFLIVNPDVVSENALLFNGQVVNVGLIDPAISVVVENNLVEDKLVTYGREIKYDNKLLVGTTYTEQKGQDGLNRVSYYTETINGSMTQVIPLSNEVITPVVNEVVVKGGLSTNYVGDTGSWFWPTKKPYVITDRFGPRFDPISGERSYHRGTDISGTGYYSPIFAAQTGTIIDMGYSQWYGNFITIQHNEDYQTTYMHLANFVTGMQKGRAVSKGEHIGYMGSTGWSTGTHLHFGVIYKGDYVDPMQLSYN